eukprot:CAMPEP_0116072180 /NCGR_PEP_ID=MMETSP0322-20121206/14323_1 /TAXON_ID=163516 /ORGANISM="Leptocylindrus danicus var. apora, Strain B651" /LENGTH=48 /DNA_ID= /DNA_START= /DNA_END= /DNA_ORIENTATION=
MNANNGATKPRMPRDTSIPGDGSDELGAKYCRVIYHSPTIAEEWHLTV